MVRSSRRPFFASIVFAFLFGAFLFGSTYVVRQQETRQLVESNLIALARAYVDFLNPLNPHMRTPALRQSALHMRVNKLASNTTQFKAQILGHYFFDKTGALVSQSGQPLVHQVEPALKSLSLSHVTRLIKQHMPVLTRAPGNAATTGLSRQSIYLPAPENARNIAAIRVDIAAMQPNLLPDLFFSSAMRLSLIVSLVLSALLGFGLYYMLRKREHARQRMEYLRTYDRLTALPNREFFRDYVNAALYRATYRPERFAVFSIDIDDFTMINDDLGFTAGDALLVQVAQRLTDGICHDAVVARVSSDGFMVLCQQCATPDSAQEHADQLHQLLVDQYHLDGQDCHVSVSIGAAIGPDDGSSYSDFMKSLDLALQWARMKDRASIQCFHPRMDQKLRERRQLIRDLKAGLETDAFTVLYQPQYDFREKAIVGHEALVRWIHPERGVISPASFIPVAEDTGLIIQLGEYVLRKACFAAMRHSQTSKIAVNLSPVQFTDDLVSVVQAALNDSGLPARRLELEITESLLLDKSNHVAQTLQRLKAMGIRIAMDDFGTGYSSLSYLTSFSFDKIKIDKSFVDHIGQDPRSDAIVTTLINLGRILDMEIIAEGVETQHQASLLRAAGCRLAQGYYYGKPAPAETLGITDPAMLADQIEMPSLSLQKLAG